MTASVLVETTRTDIHTAVESVESRFHGHVVVTGGDGGTIAALGEAERPTFIRSAAKPFQAAACLDLLRGVVADLSSELVAVGWSSHRAEPAHVEAVARLCDLAQLDPRDLTCPPARPADDPAAPLAPIHHNCSGKHALFAVTGRRLGIGRDELLDPAGALQTHVLDRLQRDIGHATAVAVDGCGAPAVEVPLRALAAAYGRVSMASGTLGEVVAAGRAHPHLVGGRGRIETALLAHDVVAKVGAEGVYGIGHGGVGIAVKVESGVVEAAAVTAHHLVSSLGWYPADAWSPDPIIGGGRPTGRWRAAPDLIAFAETLASRVGSVRKGG
ncbi:MAG: asparaginase [Actinobacteria bacterium]|nr:asparaginase [Actinomycetota bacterium]